MTIQAVIKRYPLVLALALGAVALMLAISEASYRQSVSKLDALREMAAARTALQGLRQAHIDAETGQRGYLLTDRQEYLQPYEAALAEIDASFGLLRRHYDGDAESAALLGKLRTLSDKRLSELALTIHMHRQGRDSATRDLVLSGIGKEQMDGIRELSGELLARETQRVEQSRAEIYRTLTAARIGIVALSLMGLVGLIMLLRQHLRLKLQDQVQQRMLKAERDRLDVEVQQRTAQLTELMQHLQTAREDERNRLARNLHDELGALLTSAKLDAARIKSRLAGTAPEALERLAHLVGTLNSSIALGRRIIEDLRPSTLANLGLAPTLDILAREFAERSGLQVHCELQAVKLEANAELVIYRVVQEAITNISKYATADNVWIALAASDGQVEVSVRDDGAGFDTAVKPGSAYGLVGMRFRVEAEGGTLTLQSAPGQGTLIRVRLPESTPAA